MTKEFDLSHMRSSRLGDSFHLHVYSLDPEGDSMRLHFKNRLSTDSNGILISLGLQAEAKMGLKAMTDCLEARISEETLFRLV
jgi:hypothetical protein